MSDYGVVLSAGHDAGAGPADTCISEIPEILTAHRHLQLVWAREPHCRPRLRARWHARAARLGPGTVPSSQVVTFPEAVALAEILTDPGWRHHTATAPRQDDQFYRRIAARLSERPYQAPAPDDLVITWAWHHRSTFAGTRERALSSA